MMSSYPNILIILDQKYLVLLAPIVKHYFKMLLTENQEDILCLIPQNITLK